jgi:acyl-CoA thioester hydrolase
VSSWDLPDPFIHVVRADGSDIDAYRHVNNAVYVRWLDHCAWAHSTALGLDPQSTVAGGRGMAVWRTQLNYLAPALEGDEVGIATWLVYNDERLRIDRRFQLRRLADGQTLLRGLIHYVCIDLASGRPKRMPASFAAYRPLPAVLAAVALESVPFQPGVEPR